MKRSEMKKKPRKLWLKIPLIIILLLGVGIGVYAVSVYNNAKTTVNEKMHEPVNSIEREVVKKKVKATEPLNILLLGVDARAGDRGRSDALMVLSLDPTSDSMQLVSIPRDTRTTIIGKGFDDKINHAYAYGGVDMSVATVENFLDIELDHYVRMNMEGLEELVDELGTISVNNEIAWNDGTYDFGIGPVEMGGDKTMHFVRMRKQDPNGDFGRTTRQRQVIQGIVEQGASVGSITKIDSMLAILGNNMATSLDFADMKKLLTGYKDTRKNFVSYQMTGSGTNIDGIYYFIVPDEEIAKVHGMINEVNS
ncbi:transcriptional regulator LytR [Virgibacillus profundi]|uniref:Transcriptional regulator LytR n=1 Tax=Virgibacillus profundi TaxID=2024555 RepID=A0A2A2I8G4_9BACI|nr:LCP family protein [Virgibacillus profundi]PAV28301.1 transcriptional regulator LytR [Virgibacillus profundi]PXY54910.1 transcriptional regulator LytR [Virgibacillus profundi]